MAAAKKYEFWQLRGAYIAGYNAALNGRPSEFKKELEVQRVCVHCGAPVPAGATRRALYCTNTCKQRAFRKRQETPTNRLCECGCGHHAVLGSRYAAGAAHRKRKSRVFGLEEAAVAEFPTYRTIPEKL